MAAPVGGQIFSEILPYLEVTKGNEEEIEFVEQVVMPDVVGKNILDAEKELKSLGLEIEFENEEIDKENANVREQIPTSGIMLNKGSKCFLY